MVYQTDDLQEAIFLVDGLQKVREFQQHELDWCSNNHREYNERYGDMETVEQAIESCSINIKKIDAMLAAANKLRMELTLRKAKTTTMPQSVIESLMKQIDTMV